MQRTGLKVLGISGGDGKVSLKGRVCLVSCKGCVCKDGCNCRVCQRWITIGNIAMLVKTCERVKHMRKGVKGGEEVRDGNE